MSVLLLHSNNFRISAYRMNVIQDLPPELLDIVFSHLYEEDWEVSWYILGPAKAALDSCTRVCRAWNAVARPHLFRDIVYSFRPNPYSVLANEDGEYPRDDPRYAMFDPKYRPDARFKTFPMFFAFVQRSPMAQESIRRLRLEAWPRGSSTFYEDHDGVDAKLFSQLLQLLPRLRVLHMANVSIIHGPIYYAPLVHPSLKRLFIICQIGSYIDGSIRQWMDMNVATVLDCFAKIDELHLDLPGLPRLMSSIQDAAPLEMHRLLLGDSQYLDEGLNDYLFSVRNTRGIRYLAFDFVSPDTSPDLLANIGHEIETLRLDLPTSEDFSEYHSPSTSRQSRYNQGFRD
jgi:hypothetical protein